LAGVGGADIRFFDDVGNLLAHEIETWDPDGPSKVWVGLPSVTTGTAGSTIWLAYDFWFAPPPTPACTDDVWVDYAGVWHLSETAPGFYADSSGWNNHGAAGGSTGLNPPVPADEGLHFGGTDAGISVPPLADEAVAGDLTTFTFTFWLRLDNTRVAGLFRKGNIDIYMSGSRRLRMEAYLSSPPLTPPYLSETAAGLWHPAGPPAPWQFMALTWDGNTSIPSNTAYPGGFHTFTEGFLNSTGFPNANTGTAFGNTGQPLIIGNRWDASLDGALDEIRLSRTVRSEDWILAQYLSMTDQIITWGAEMPSMHPGP
jgi:hypothetical protein